MAARPDPERGVSVRAPVSPDIESDSKSVPVLDAPMVVAAASCRDVMLRWKSLAPSTANIDRYLVQRFPDAHQHPTWQTLLNSNASEIVDPEVHPAAEYLYRVQAVQGSSQSVFAYHSVHVTSSGCSLSGSWKALFRASLDTLAPLVRTDVLQAAGVMCACLLVVYAVVRVSAMGIQRTLRRQSQLRRLQKCEQATAASKRTARRSISGSDSSTELSSSDLQSQQHPEPRNSMFDSFRSLRSEDPEAEMGSPARLPRANSDPSRDTTRAASLSSNVGRAEFCTYCHKRFGLFRRRRICSVCHSTALCRKCGFRGSAEELRRSVIKMQAAITSQDENGQSKSKSKPKEKPIKIICRDCCVGAQRYSSAASVRPSFPAQS